MNPRTLGDEKLYQSIFNATSDGILIADPETGSVLVANPAAAGMHGYPPRDFNHLNFYKLIHANSQTLFDEFPHIVQQGNQFDTLAQHVRMDGTVFTVEWRAVAMKHQNRTYALALLRDVTNRVQAERLLRQRVGARAREQTTLLEISQTLASTLELQPGLILDQLRGLINYSQAALFTMHDSTLVAEVVRGNEQLEKSVPIFIRLDGKESLETLLTIQKPIRVSDFSSSDPTMIILLSLLKDESPVLLEGVQSWMWVPLVVKSRILGVIYAAHTARNYFSPNHADLAMIIANQVAVALVNSELHERARVLAALEERQRLAQNLHDAVNQSLFSAGLIAEVLPRLWDRNPVEARRSLEDLRRLTRERRIKACVANSMVSNMYKIFRSSQILRIRGLMRLLAAWKVPFQLRMIEIIAWRWGLDGKDFRQLVEKNRDVFFDPAEIACPTLILIGEGENANREIRRQQQHAFEVMPDPRKKMIAGPIDEGAASNCMGENLGLMSAMVFDWLDEVIA